MTERTNAALTIDHGSVSLSCRPETIQLFVDRMIEAKVARETEGLQTILRDGTKIVVALASIRERTFEKVNSGAWLDRAYAALARATDGSGGHDSKTASEPDSKNAVDWVRVPREPTTDMLDAGGQTMFVDVKRKDYCDIVRRGWKAMIAAVDGKEAVSPTE